MKTPSCPYRHWWWGCGKAVDDLGSCEKTMALPIGWSSCPYVQFGLELLCQEFWYVLVKGVLASKQPTPESLWLISLGEMVLSYLWIDHCCGAPLIGRLASQIPGHSLLSWWVLPYGVGSQESSQGGVWPIIVPEISLALGPAITIHNSNVDFNFKSLY